VQDIDKQISQAHARLRQIKSEWSQAETRRGEAFRSGAAEERERLGDAVISLRSEKRALTNQIRDLRKRKAEEASAETIRAARERRQAIEREAEIARLRTVREAVIASANMEKMNRRPSAWWFPLVTPDGSWFESLRSNVELRLEPLK
jgi:hypothetical protein